MGPRRLLAVALQVWGLAHLVVLLLSTVISYVAVQQLLDEGFGGMAEFGQMLWRGAYVSAGVEGVLCLGLLLKADALAAGVLPPGPLRSLRVRPWFEAGLAFLGVAFLVPAVAELVLALLPPIAAGGLDEIDPDAGPRFMPQLILMGVAATVVLLPRLGRALSPARLEGQA